MENLNIIEVEYDKAYKIVKEKIYSCKTKYIEVIDSHYHHETVFEKVPGILKYGILSIDEWAKVHKVTLTEEEIERYNGIHHVNGLYCVSLSSMNLDFSQLYRNEDYYDSFNFGQVDLVISKEVKAARNTINFFNEFLVSTKVPVDKINGIDLKVLESYKKEIYPKTEDTKFNRTKKLLKNYNYLKYISRTLINNSLDIPIREVSEEKITLDPQKIIKLPSIKLR